jgi:hypothetical protein
MSDKPISVGDLAVVLKTHCDSNPNLGRIVTVDSIVTHWIRCIQCRKNSVFEGRIAIYCVRGERFGSPLPWLKRIPPLDELENIDVEDKLDVRA